MYNTIEVKALEIRKAEIKYLKKDGFISDSNNNVKHVKVLPWLSIVQSVEGSYDITLGTGRKEQTGDGGFFIAPSGVQQTIVHHVNSESGRMKCRWLFIDVEINNAYKLDSLYKFPHVVDNTAKKELHALFELLFAADDIWENYSCCYKILGLLLRLAMPLEQSFNHSMQRAVDYMVTNFARPLCIKELAGIANISESNFYAVFKKQFGVSPISYLNHYRLSLAAERIIETNERISEICERIGIKDSLYFSKLFKKTYGVTPREYRLAHEKQSRDSGKIE